MLPSQVAPGGGEVDKSDESLEIIFKQIDVDRSGQIDEREMQRAIRKIYGKGIGDEMVKEMMQRGDTNKDGEVGPRP